MEKLNGLHSDHLLREEMSQYVKDKTLLVNMHVVEGYQILRDEFYSEHFIWACILYCKYNYYVNACSNRRKNLLYS